MQKSLPNTNLQAWLNATGSLTTQLETLSGKKLLVMPTFEGRKSLTLAEKKRLNLPIFRPQSAWVRQSLLFGQYSTNPEQAWVMACSIFPFASLTGNAKQLSNLGGRPIGYVMFGRHGAILKQRWLTHTVQGWQRSSLYDWQGRYFLICETFLPAFEQMITSHNHFRPCSMCRRF